MKKRINLALAAFLLGGLTTALPTPGRILVFASLAFYLFVTFDFWEYEQRCGGAE